MPSDLGGLPFSASCQFRGRLEMWGCPFPRPPQFLLPSNPSFFCSKPLEASQGGGERKGPLTLPSPRHQHLDVQL